MMAVKPSRRVCSPWMLSEGMYAINNHPFYQAITTWAHSHANPFYSSQGMMKIYRPSIINNYMGHRLATCSLKLLL